LKENTKYIKNNIISQVRDENIKIRVGSEITLLSYKRKAGRSLQGVRIEKSHPLQKVFRMNCLNNLTTQELLENILSHDLSQCSSGGGGAPVGGDAAVRLWLVDCLPSSC